MVNRNDVDYFLGLPSKNRFYPRIEKPVRVFDSLIIEEPDPVELLLPETRLPQP